MLASEKNKAAYAMALGRKMARLDGGWLVVGHAPGERSALWANAAVLGGCEAGAKLFELGEVSHPVFQFAMAITHSSGGIYIGGGESPAVQLAGEQGLPLSRQEEQLIRSALPKDGKTAIGRTEKITGLWELYCSRLHHLAGERLKGSRCVLRCGNPVLQRQAREVLSALGCQLLDGPLLWLNNTGERLAAFTPNGQIIPFHKLIERACRLSFAQGKTVALPEGLAPMAETFGPVLRYSLRPAALSADQRAARDISARQLWERDGLMLAVLMLCSQRQGSLDLYEEGWERHPNGISFGGIS